VRKIILGALVAVGFAAAAQARDPAQGVNNVMPKTAAEAAPAAAPAPAAVPAPVVAAQPPAPPPAPVPMMVELPWPANVPSLKPGTDLAIQTAMPAKPAAGTPAKAVAMVVPNAAKSQSPAQSPTKNQTAALTPAPSNAAAVTLTKVTLQASVMAGAKPMPDLIQWTVSKPTADNRAGETVATQTASKAMFSLAPGSYVLTIRDQEAIASQPLVVGSTPMAKLVPLNLSVLHMKLIPYTGAKPVTQPVHWEVFASALGRPGPNSKIADAVSPMTVFHLTQGYYVVRSHYLDVTSDLAMQVEPGVTYAYTVDLYAANLSTRVVGIGGKKPAGSVTWQVVRQQADLDGQHRVVATNTGPQPNFLVREGDYTVIATSADGAIGEAAISIKAGHNHQLTVRLKPAGKPTATATSTN
jgi:hypothetical protein